MIDRAPLAASGGTRAPEVHRGRGFGGQRRIAAEGRESARDRGAPPGRCGCAAGEDAPTRTEAAHAPRTCRGISGGTVSRRTHGTPRCPVSTTPDLVRIRELPIAHRTIRLAIHAGELPAYKIGRDYHVSAAEFTRWVEARRVRPRSAAPARPATPADAAVAHASAAGGLRPVRRGR